jgi:hypothetical protein
MSKVLLEALGGGRGGEHVIETCIRDMFSLNYFEDYF